MWHLWSNDLFDREAAPTDEHSGVDPLGGFALLWRKTLAEGVQADGRPTFTWFQLKWDAGSLSLPRDPSSNPELARLKGWLETKGVIIALAKTLAAAPQDETARRCLREAAAASDAMDLCVRLGHPVAPPPRKRRFDFFDSGPLVAFLASPQAADATALKLEGPNVGLDAIRALAASTALSQVAFLWLDGVSLGDDGMELLAAAHLPSLRTLGICDSGVTGRGVTSLAQASWALGVRDLTLANRANTPPERPNAIGADGPVSLATHLQNLEVLDLGFNPLGDAGVEALLGPTSLPMLRELVVWRTGMTADGATRCARLVAARPRFCVVHSDFTPRRVDYSEG